MRRTSWRLMLPLPFKSNRGLYGGPGAVLLNTGLKSSTSWRLTLCVSLKSGGQALVPQARLGLTPMKFSTVVLNPSQSGSVPSSCTGHGGNAWVGLKQLGQLSLASGTPSPSVSWVTTTCWHAENSEVLPDGSVAVDVTN